MARRVGRPRKVHRGGCKCKKYSSGRTRCLRRVPKGCVPRGRS